MSQLNRATSAVVGPKSQTAVFRAIHPWGILLVIGCCLIFNGCRPTADSPQTETTSGGLETISPEPLVLLVVDIRGGELGESIARQWMAEMGGVIEVREIDPQTFAANNFQIPAEVDVVIYPATLLGELESRRGLVEFSGKVWSSDEFNRSELLPVYRSKLVRHANRNWGIPLGGPQFALMYDRDWLQQQGGKIPDLWDDWLLQIAPPQTAVAEGLRPEVAFQMPLAEGWAVEIFLLRVGSMIRSRGRLSTVFDRSTMQPLIDTLPFQKGLEDLKRLMGDSTVHLELTPADVFRNVLRGDCKSGITWLHPVLDSSGQPEDQDQQSVNIGFGSLPGHPQWFDTTTQRWIRRSSGDTTRSDLVGFAGRLASVSSGSRVTDQGFEFLAWLGNKTTALKTVAGDPYFGPFRASQLGNPTRWSGDLVSEQAAQEYADLILSIQDQDINFMFPRIPGRQRYLTALDQSIRSCLKGEIEVPAALEKVAAEWEQITEEIGRKQLIQELRKDAGL